jgi:hypothetical protein
LPEPERTGHWAAGARASYELAEVMEAGLSFHEERENGELGRRTLGLDLYAVPLEPLSAGVNGLFDTDQTAIADLRVFARYDHEDIANVTGQYVRTDPALFLSHQSVLSVFGTDAFDEAGLEVGVDPTRWFEVGGAGYVQIWSGDDLGTRWTVRARAVPDPEERLTLQGVYSRVDAIDNGYHSIRTSIRYRFMSRAAAVAEQYTYLYDEPINGHESSLVEALSVSYAPLDPLSLLLGGSIAQTPYAEMDAQVQAIATLTFDGVGARP